MPAARRKDVTYGQFICNVRPEKKERHRTRFEVGGDSINYPGEVATPTAKVIVAKLLFNSVVSTPGAKFMTMDISHFYLTTPLKRPEYIRINIRDIPQEIIDEYNLHQQATVDGSIYIVANRGMYGLPQSGLLANELLEERLTKRGYRQSKLVPGLWKHDWRPVQFTLDVDDFGTNYAGDEHAQHLKRTLEENYTVTTEWEGKRYIGITLDWDYRRRQVHLSMPGYIDKALKRFAHQQTKAQHQPFPDVPIKYGAKKQYATQQSTAPPLDQKGKKFIQQVCGKFLFLGRAVDSTLLFPISAIASQSVSPTEDTMRQTHQEDAKSTCQCPATSIKPSKDLPINKQRHNTNHSQTFPSNTGQRSNMQPNNQPLRHLTKKERNSSNKSVENSYSSVELWTALSSSQSVPSHPSPQVQQRIQCAKPINYWTTLQPRRKQSSRITRVT